MISVNGVKKQLGYTSYAASTGGNPSTNAIYYVGSTERTMTNLTGGQNPVYIPKSGSIKAVYVTWLATGVAGSNEQIDVYLRLNNTTDTLIASVSDTNALKTFSNTTFNTAVVQGDYFEIKVVCPAWATIPTGVLVTAEVYIEVPDLGISINGVKNKSGYVLSPSGAQSNPADDATFYIGNCLTIAHGTAGNNPVYIPKDGLIKVVYITWLAVSVIGSGQQIYIYLRLNNTTDTLVASVIDSNRTKIFSNTSLNIAVAKGDYFEIKVVCPTWDINPTAVNISGDIYIEPTNTVVDVNGVGNESAYVLTGAGSQANPSDGQTYYVGSISQTWTNTTAGNGPIYVPKAGLVKAAYITLLSTSVVGSNEQIDVYLRLNNTTDTLIASVSDTSASKTFSNTTLNIEVAQGDYFEIKIVCPTWATNPTNTTVAGEIYITEG